eukprot:6674564-Lingulodinium_polyedra.AAC.1
MPSDLEAQVSRSVWTLPRRRGGRPAEDSPRARGVRALRVARPVARGLQGKAGAAAGGRTEGGA